MKRTESQKANIRRHLESGESINPMKALCLFGCFRLAAKIFELKKDGMDIETTMIYTKDAHFAQYSLKK